MGGKQDENIQVCGGHMWGKIEGGVCCIVARLGLDDGDVHPSIHPLASKLMSCNRRASEGDFSSEEAKMCEQPIPFWSEVGRPAGRAGS